MDGVVAQYERNAYAGNYAEDAEHHEKPRFLREPDYFRTCTPDMTIIKAFSMLNEHNVNIIVLSNIMDSPIMNGHIDGKRTWLCQYMPFIDDFHPIQKPKAEYVSETILKRSLKPTDILISDFNNDLVPWDRSGGTGVKYINGLNSPESYTGKKIFAEWDEYRIAQFLLALINP